MATSAGQAVWLRFVQVGSAQRWTDRGSSFAPGLVAPGLAPGFARERVSLHYASSDFEQHYNDHRQHRTLGQAAPLQPLPDRTRTEINTVRRRDRLGGLLHEYQQVA